MSTKAAKSSGIAKVFMSGRSQAVRLPKEFRFSGTQVRISRVGKGLLLEPIASDVDAWLAELHSLTEGEFPAREQPPMPPDTIDLDL